MTDTTRNRASTIWNLVADTVRLPLFDINYLTSSEALDVYNYTNSYPRRGVLGCLAVFIGKGGRALLRKRAKEPMTARTIVVAVETHNQYSAAAPVHAQLGNNESKLLNLENQPGHDFPEAWAYVASLVFWPMVLVRVRHASNYQRRAYAHVLHHFLLTYGYYFVARLWFRRWRPRHLLVANDHNMKTRAVSAAAAAEGVATAYIQHASVNDRFPPLTFDCAFLDGRDALDKYSAAGPTNTTVFLSGAPKFDRYAPNVRYSTRVESLGVCIGRAEPLDVVVDLISRIRQLAPILPITLRPHPGDARDWRAILEPHEVLVSDSTKEVSFAFLAHVDAIVVGDSNIALEALLLNVSALYFDFSSRRTDNYGFIRNGTVPYFSAAEDLMQELTHLMRERPAVRANALQYIATLGTAFDGRSSELVATTLLAQAAGEGVGPQWIRIADSPIEAYEPVSEPVVS